mgnify:CR=1 FL=1
MAMNYYDQVIGQHETLFGFERESIFSDKYYNEYLEKRKKKRENLIKEITKKVDIYTYKV